MRWFSRQATALPTGARCFSEAVAYPAFLTPKGLPPLFFHVARSLDWASARSRSQARVSDNVWGKAKR